MQSEQEMNRVIEEYADTVKRICMLYLKNHADTEDIFQRVFMKYMLKEGTFKSKEHEKAWIIRVTINECKDLLKSFFRRKTVSIEEAYGKELSMKAEETEVLEAVLALPKKNKEVIYLHYYEGYTAPEIGEILGKNVNTIYTLLTRSKEMLKRSLGGNENG